MPRPTLLALTFFIPIGFAGAQITAPQANPPQRFDVASIRLLPPGAYNELQDNIDLLSNSTYPTARFFMHYGSLSRLIIQAYGSGTRLQNYPDWAVTQLYDIEATAEGGQALNHEEMEPLLQDLLVQRFHLKVHHESRLVSGYEVVAAKGGSKLQPAKENSRPRDMPSTVHALIGPSSFDAWGTSVDGFARLVSGPADKPVVDKTGLTGSYDIHLSFAPSDDPTSPLPDIFTAIQEQLGLKLVPAKVPVDYLVIDHVDRVPTEN